MKRPPMPLVLEGHHTYKGFHGVASHCGVRLYARPGQPAVAIATQLPDNPGTSITNRAEQLATYFQARAAIEWGCEGPIYWIEHYPASPHYPELFPERVKLVSFEYDRKRHRYCKPHWDAITWADVELLIGAAAPAPAPSDFSNAGDRRIDFDALYQPSSN